MQKILEILLDLIFPPRAEERIVRTLNQEIIESLLAPRMRAGVHALFPYKDPRIRALIWQLKYKGNTKAVALLTPVLVTYLNAHVPGRLLVLPIPLSRTRLHERGYNQVTLVAQELQKTLPRMVLHEDILVRAHHTDRQTTLSRLERIRNMREAFRIADPEALRGQDILILDDVTTTGATLREAGTVVWACGPRSVKTVAVAY